MKTLVVRALLVPVLGLSLLSACASEAPSEPPPVPVRVHKVTAQDKPLFAEYVGDIRADSEVAVYPRIGGIVLRRAFEEGSRVNKGQLLYVIDAQEYVSARNAALAQVAAAEAEATRADEDVARYKPLVAEDAIARQIYDNAIARAKAGAAQVAAARANLRNAEITLSYGEVRAPISGIIGKSAVSEGQLVAPGKVELARISNASEIKVYFSPSEDEILAYNSLPPEERGNLQNSIKLILADGTVVPQTGSIDFADREIDPETGTYRLRATFPNPGQKILPGEFGRVQIPSQTKQDAVVVPDRAVIEQFGSYFVMVVGEDNTVEQRQVKVGVQAGGEWIIEDGLEPGETVIVEGISKVQQGSVIQPMPRKGEGQPAAAPKADEAQAAPDGE